MSSRKKRQKRAQQKTPPPKLRVMFDAEVAYARELLAEIEPFAAVRRAEALAAKDTEARS